LTADGKLEILGVDVVSVEDGAAWTVFLRGLVAGDCTGPPGYFRRPRGAEERRRRHLGGSAAGPTSCATCSAGYHVGPSRGGHPGALQFRPTRRHLDLGGARFGCGAAPGALSEAAEMLRDPAPDLLPAPAFPRTTRDRSCPVTPRRGSLRSCASAPTWSGIFNGADLSSHRHLSGRLRLRSAVRRIRVIS